MGRASRWLKGFLGMKKDRENVVHTSLASSDSFKREKKRWSFSSVKPTRDSDSNALVPAKTPARVSASDAFWVFDSDVEKGQSKHAMAVAAATAAAADAAVAAAEAAVAVVKLTGQRRGASPFAGGREGCAAVVIQSAFRGFLARKALRALKGLVKIQALVRGYLVRKRAATALRRMQTLIRAQTTVRTERARRSLDKENVYPLENQPRRSVESFDETRSEFHSKRLPVPCDITVSELENYLKTVEVDKPRTQSRSRRISSVPLADLSDGGIPYSSPLPCPIVSKMCTPNSGKLRGPEWYFSSYDEFRFKTDENTHKLQNRCNYESPTTPVTKPMRVVGDGRGHGHFHPYSSVPSYMANTKSFKAKSRSQSAPRQRVEAGSKKRVPLSEIMASRNRMSSVRMEKSCSNLEEIFE